MPFTAPTTMPVPSMAATTAHPDGTSAKTSAPTTEASASVEPTDRSMPRVRITSSWPMASSAITADWASTLPALPVLRNTGDSSDITATSASRISAGPVRMSRRAARSSW